MANPPSSGSYTDYPITADLTIVTPDGVTGLSKAPPPPPDPPLAPTRTQGVQSAEDGLLAAYKRPRYGTLISDVDIPEDVVVSALNEERFNAVKNSTDPTAAYGMLSPEDQGKFKDWSSSIVSQEIAQLEQRAGAVPPRGQATDKSGQQAAADQRKGGTCDSGWYDTAIQQTQNYAGFRKQSAIKGGNPLCDPGANSDTRYTMTEWDGIPREARTPFVITTQHRIEKGVPLWPNGSQSGGNEASNSQFLIFRVNPNQLHITQALRGAEAKTRIGTVYYVWQDPLKRSFFDEPTVGITFDSGNLLPWTWLNSESGMASGTYELPLTIPVPPGMETFYRFMALLNESKMMPDGRPNFVYVTINTRKFPQLTLAGWFTPEGIGSITDSADDPNHLTWTANFHCRATYPRLYNSGELLTMFKTMAATLPRPLVHRTQPQHQEDVTVNNALEVGRQLGPTGGRG